MKMRKTMLRVLLAVVGAFWMASGSVQAAEKLKPFVLAAEESGDLATVVESVKGKLSAAGFEIAGDYAPYPGARAIAITSNALKEVAAKSKRGGFGAVIRVGVTQVGDKIQVAYANPPYWAAAFRLKGDLRDVAEKLASTLGKIRDFGSKKGLTEKKLRKYHYKVMMPYFDDPYELGEFGSHDEAVAKVEEGLSKGAGGTGKVYRVDIPGADMTLFGVALSGAKHECSGDKYIMDYIDFSDTKHTPHLPYEVLVDGKEVVALHAKFRIAISFPDLSMMGKNSFMSIMCAPGAIEEALEEMVGK